MELIVHLKHFVLPHEFVSDSWPAVQEGWASLLYAIHYQFQEPQHYVYIDLNGYGGVGGAVRFIDFQPVIQSDYVIRYVNVVAFCYDM